MSSEKMLLLGIVAFIGILVAAKAALFFRSFKKEWDYLTQEINRSTGESRERWKRVRKRMLLSLIPFYKPKRSHKSRH